MSEPQNIDVVLRGRSIRVTEEQLEQARNWIAEITWRDIHGNDDIDELTPTEIVGGVNRHHSGGWSGFLSCAE